MIGLPALAQVPVTVVAREGEQAPGAPSGTTFNNFFAPTINNDGVVAFRAALQGAGVTSANRNGFFVGPVGGIELLAREGDPAPGTAADVVFAGFSLERLNQQGQVAFIGTLSGPGVTPNTDTGIWVGTPGALQLVVREGDPAPGTAPGVILGVLPRLRLSSSGDLLFFAGLQGSGVTSANEFGIWAGLPGALQLVAREGDPAPGAPPGAVYRFSLSSQGGSINSSGQIVFNASLTGGGTIGGGLWIGVPGNLTLIARRDDEAPGTGVGVVFTSFRPPLINDSGEVAFGGLLAGPGVNAGNFQGAWAGNPADLKLVLRDGDQAPGLANGETFDIGLFAGVATLNGTGKVSLPPGITLLAGPSVTAANDQGVWFGTPGGLQLLHREGDPAPGTAGDLVLSDLFRIATNSRDEVLFLSSLAGPQSPPSQNGLWLASPSGTELMIRTGDVVELAPGELRAVGLLAPIASGGGNQSGSVGALNDEGQVVFVGGIPQLSESAVFVLSARSNDPPRCDLAQAVPEELWPPNHALHPVVIEGVTDEDAGSQVTIAITGVTQDEPVDDAGDGATSPDAGIEAGFPSDQVLIRAERASQGDGRVYEISFIASDGLDSCVGTVTVGVPKNKKSLPIDSGQDYDSMLP